jgi:colanic acid biosynthesis glycosyl transferase WcaI
MKILLYSLNFSPELTGIGKYSGEMAEWLNSAGHEVHVVAAPPYYPNWKVWPNFKKSWNKQQTLDGIKIWRAPLWVPEKPSGLKRLMHLSSFALSSLPLMLRQLAWRPDIVWVVEPPLFCAPTALFVAKLARARAWLHIQDYEVDAAFSLGLVKGKAAYQIVSKVEKWLMCHFDKVSTISNRMVEVASTKGVPPEKISIFPNWINLDEIHPLPTPSEYRNILNIPENAVVALYSGNMGEKQGLEILSAAANQLADEKNLHFVFCGNGPAKEKLKSQTKDLLNVHFMDLQPTDRLNDLLGLADIHLLPQRADTADLVLPSKLTGMLASGRPIIATANTDTELGKVVCKCGLAVTPGRPEELALAITSLASNPTLREMMGNAGRRYAETNLGKDSILMDFASGAEDLCKRKQAYTAMKTADD